MEVLFLRVANLREFLYALQPNAVVEAFLRNSIQQSQFYVEFRGHRLKGLKVYWRYRELIVM